MILIYAFSNQWGTNISHRTLLELQKILKEISPLHQGEMSLSDRRVLPSKSNLGFDFRLVRFDFKSFFQKYIFRNQYDLIIGLGDIYGNFNKIRIETQVKNAYNNQSIYPFSPIFLDLNLPNLDNFDSQYFAISSHLSAYNCNWLAYSTQLHIDQKKLDTKHLFLSLPKKANAIFLASQIKNLLELNKII